MSLILWIPLNGNFENQGIINMQPISMTNIEWITGKLCSKCLYIKRTPSNTITVPELNGKEEFSISVWWKLNESDMSSASHYTRFFSVFMDTDGVENIYRIEHCNNTTQPGTVQSLFPRNGNNFSPGYRGYGSHSGHKYQWNHEVVCVDKHTAKWYLNGQQVYTLSVSDICKDYMHLTGKLYLGQSGAMAQLQDFRIYDHCLSAREVKEISKGLILHYPLSSPYCEPVTELYGEKYANGLALAKNGEITSNLCTDEDGSPYTNYSFSKPPESTKDTWYSINFGSYPFTAGKTYTISVDYRVNSCQNCDFTLRHARIGNDYFGCKTFSLITKNNVGKGWQHASITQIIPDKFDYNGTEKICKPQIEWYTGNLKNSATDTTTVRSANFDLKNVQVIEKDHDLPFGTRAGIEYDCSGYGNNGTMELETAPSWIADSTKYSGCYQFNGIDSMLTLGNFSMGNLLSNQFTISFWIYNDDINSRSIYFGDYGSANGNKMNIEKTKSNILRFWWNNGSPDLNINAFTILDKTWYNIVITVDIPSNIMKFYKNGICVYTYATALSPLNSISKYNIGRDSRTGDTVFNGKLSDFRIYATALSDSDIKDLYETKFSLDNSGNFFVGELIEDTQTVGFGQNAVLSSKEFYEFDSQNLCYMTTYGDAPFEYGYTPSTENNSKFEFYRVHQNTLQVGDIVVVDLDFEWSGGFDTSNANGTFDLYFQGECQKNNDTTAYWVTNEYANSLNSIKRPKELVLSSESGVFHYTAKRTVTTSMLDYDIKFIGLRSNYSNGKGNVSFKNVCVRKLKYSDDGTGKLKIPDDGTLACKEIIEY